MRSQLKNKRGHFFLPHWDLNHGTLESKARVLAISCKYKKPRVCKSLIHKRGLLWTHIKKRFDFRIYFVSLGSRSELFQNLTFLKPLDRLTQNQLKCLVNSLRVHILVGYNISSLVSTGY